MTVAPQQLPAQVADGRAPGIQYRVEGQIVPVLHVALDGSVPLYFEHHVVLWKTPNLQIGIKGLKGAFKRVIAGMPVFLTQTENAGEVAFSRDGAGHVFPIHLEAGQAVEVREHQFLAAMGNVEYTFSRQKGVANMLFGSSGFFVDRFAATNHEGVIWLHGYGNVFEQVLAPGESIDVEPGGWVYRDESVTMNQQVYGLKTGIFGGSGQLVFNRFTGPGRVGIQSMYLHLASGEDAKGSVESAAAGAVGGAIVAKAIGSFLKRD